ncbi:MAG: hypothetical protein AAF468_22235 [Pseudomonadota bacterium]
MPLSQVLTQATKLELVDGNKVPNAQLVKRNDFLPDLIDRVADRLDGARDIAEILEARADAISAQSELLQAAKAFGQAESAHDDFTRRIRLMQMDIVLMLQRADMMLVEKYDFLDEEGLTSKGGRPAENSHLQVVEKTSPDPGGVFRVNLSDCGLTSQAASRARKLIELEAKKPGILEDVLLDRINAGQEPNKEALRKLAEHGASLRGTIGTKCAPHDERGNDLNETCAEAIATLLKLEKFAPTLWDPCNGRSAISDRLERAGYELIRSDKVDYGTGAHCHDFLDPLPGFVSTLETPPDIATNPPYMIADEFILSALNSGARKVAMLLPIGRLAGFGKKRSAIHNHRRMKLARVHVFSRRLPMMHRDDWDGPEAPSRIDFAWFVWEEGWDGPTLTTRVDWSRLDQLPPISSMVDEERWRLTRIGRGEDGQPVTSSARPMERVEVERLVRFAYHFIEGDLGSRDVLPVPPRAAAIWLLNQLCNVPQALIGQALGKTKQYANQQVNKVERRAEKTPGVESLMDALYAEFEG